mmetsp:Transcript_22567/g.46059  ORF Transcript_22567/g.46059 Transcript_22567/m.46059 type:complete len:168 (+) Transcript_22567:362-865(+)
MRCPGGTRTERGFSGRLGLFVEGIDGRPICYGPGENSRGEPRIRSIVERVSLWQRNSTDQNDAVQRGTGDNEVRCGSPTNRQSSFCLFGVICKRGAENDQTPPAVSAVVCALNRCPSVILGFFVVYLPEPLVLVGVLVVATVKDDLELVTITSVSGMGCFSFMVCQF